MHLRANLVLDSNRKMATAKLKINYKAQKYNCAEFCSHPIFLPTCKEYIERYKDTRIGSAF
jgi:hypothetical protein